MPMLRGAGRGAGGFWPSVRNLVGVSASLTAPSPPGSSYAEPGVGADGGVSRQSGGLPGPPRVWGLSGATHRPPAPFPRQCVLSFKNHRDLCLSPGTPGPPAWQVGRMLTPLSKGTTPLKESREVNHTQNTPAVCASSPVGQAGQDASRISGHTVLLGHFQLFKPPAGGSQGLLRPSREPGRLPFSCHDTHDMKFATLTAVEGAARRPEAPSQATQPPPRASTSRTCSPSRADTAPVTHPSPTPQPVARHLLWPL